MLKEATKNFCTALEKCKDNFGRDEIFSKVLENPFERFIDLPDSCWANYADFPLKKFRSKRFGESTEKTDIGSIEEYIFPECKESVIVFVNGFLSELSRLGDIEDKVSLKSEWEKPLEKELDPMAILNMAFCKNGFLLSIPEDCQLQCPIQILHIVDTDEPEIVVPQIYVIAEADSKVNLISDVVFLSETENWFNQLYNFTVHDSAHVHYTDLQTNIGQNWFFSSCRARLHRDAKLEITSIYGSCAASRHDYLISLEHEGASADISGFAHLSGSDQRHVNVSMNHLASHTSSSQIFREILKGRGKAYFSGDIFVDEELHAIEARQLKKSLMLSESARSKGKPIMKIFSEDVKVSHGLTIGQLNEDQLLYCRTRGISEKEGKKLLINAFSQKILERIKFDSLHKRL